MPQLHEVKPGHRATVVSWTSTPPVRLLEMGLLPGTEVEMVRLAPLGDPLEIRVRGYLLSLRREEASAIEVELTGPQDQRS